MTHEDKETPTVEFNVTKELLTSSQDKLLSTKILQSNTTGSAVEPDNMINLSQKSQEDPVVIRSRNKYFVLPSEETVKILCKNKYDVLDSRLSILAVADERKCIKGLWAEKKLVTVTELQNYITVSVTNTTQHDIFVPKNQLFQHLQLINSVTSIPVKPNPATNVPLSKILTCEEQIPSLNLYNNSYSSPFIHIEIAVTQHAKST